MKKYKDAHVVYYYKWDKELPNFDLKDVYEIIPKHPLHKTPDRIKGSGYKLWTFRVHSEKGFLGVEDCKVIEQDVVDVEKMLIKLNIK